MAGLMDKLATPEMAMWLGGLGKALSTSSRGGNFDMSQANMGLMQQMQQRRMREKMQGLMSGMNMDPQQAEFMKTYGQMDPSAAMGVLGKQLFPEEQKRAEWERKAENLMQMGAPQEVAYGLQTGRYKTVTHPVTQQLMVIDMATGQPYQGWQPAQGGAPGASPAMAGGGAPAPAGGGAQPAYQPEPDSGADYPSAFGAEGIVKNVANIASDFVGAGQLYPDAATAKRQIENLNTQTATLLAEGTETRGGKYLIDRFDKIQAEAGGIQGPEDALKTLGEIKGLLERAYQINQRIAQSEVRPTEKSSATATLRRLEPMIEEYDQIIREFDQQYRGRRAPQGLPADVRDVWEYMTPEERALWQN